MAPEIITRSGTYNARVDIWAVGVTLYQLLTGRLPFAAPSVSQVLHQIVHAPHPRLDADCPHRQELDPILDRALAKNPLNRYASAADLVQDLRRVEGEISYQAYLPVDNLAAAEKEPWWASTVVVHSSSPVSPLIQATETISIAAGNIPARRGGHMVRFAEYNVKTMPFALFGILCAGLYAIVAISAGPPGVAWVDTTWPASAAPPPDGISGAGSIIDFWPLAAYFFGILVPFLLAISIILGLLTLWEKVAAAPTCRKCKTWMEDRSTVSCFAYSAVSWHHASSDCLAALQENLWEDAAKLLTLHGELDSPEPGQRTSYPPIRYHLDFYACPQCGDQCALLNTEDRIGATWSAREEFDGAYKQTDSPAVRPSFFARIATARRATQRAAQLAAEPVSLAGSVIFLLPALLLGLYYYPQLPVIVGTSGSRATIVIQSNPNEQSIVVDGYSITTPKTFSWSYGSPHTISGLSSRRVNGVLYRFQALGPAVAFRIDDPSPRSVLSSEGQKRTVAVTAARDRWGRLASWPRVAPLTVEFAPSSPANAAPAELMAEMLARVNERQTSGAAINHPLPAVTPTFVVTSEPAGLSVQVDGDWIITPKSYRWRIGSTHTLSAPAGTQVFSQSTSGIKSPTPILYADGRWITDPEAHSIQVTVPAARSSLETFTYTAKFRRVATFPEALAAPPPPASKN
jgi:hypothetical protein